MKFPDTELALEEVLTDKAPLVAHLPKDVHRTVPLVQISPIPSPSDTEPFLRIERYLLDVYEVGRTKARNLANEITELLDGHYFDTSHGLLDRVEVAVLPNESPLEDDQLNSFNLSIVVHTRRIA